MTHKQTPDPDDLPDDFYEKWSSYGKGAASWNDFAACQRMTTYRDNLNSLEEELLNAKTEEAKQEAQKKIDAFKKQGRGTRLTIGF